MQTRTRDQVVRTGFDHLFADFIGVKSAQLRDGGLIGGLLIAAAGAAGFPVLAAPMVRELPHGGFNALLQLDGCHMAVHTFPDRGLLLLDVLALSSHDSRKALDVFARRLPAREIRSAVHQRG